MSSQEAPDAHSLAERLDEIADEQLSKADHDTLKEASAALRQMAAPGWRTIESAPRDGRHVLLAITDDDPPGYGYVAEGFYEEDGARGWYHANTHWTDAYDGSLRPSYWQPLPAAPSAPTGETE